jgi:Cof subfamily protein (haloacid dehalogenase superfamily)
MVRLPFRRNRRRTRRPGLVVLDLDGTVVGYHTATLEPSERVRSAIAAVLAAGIPVTVATGRAVWGALPTVASLGLAAGDAPLDIVCTNGAVVYDVAAGRVTHRVTIDPRPAALALLEINPDVGLAVETGTEGYRYNGTFQLNFESRFLGEADLPELLAEPTTRLCCRVPGDDGVLAGYLQRREEATALLAAAELDPAAYHAEIGFSGWIDICAAGVSKATGAAMIADDLGVEPADVVVVGDGSNDLAMFAWAGHAVAMGQAPEQVLNAADEITAPVDEDGVAVLLERWA